MHKCLVYLNMDPYRFFIHLVNQSSSKIPMHTAVLNHLSSEQKYIKIIWFTSCFSLGFNLKIHMYFKCIDLFARCYMGKCYGPEGSFSRCFCLLKRCMQLCCCNNVKMLESLQAGLILYRDIQLKKGYILTNLTAFSLGLKDLVFKKFP